MTFPYQNMTILLAVFFCISIAIDDLIRKKIANKILIIFIVLNYCFIVCCKNEFFLSSIFGIVIGFLFFIIPFLLNGVGAGDVKAFAVLGAIIGPSAIFQTFLYTGLFGGVVALLHYIMVYDIRKKALAGIVAISNFAISRDVRCLIPEAPKKRYRFPYAPAIALGYLAYLTWGNLV